MHQEEEKCNFREENILLAIRITKKTLNSPWGKNTAHWLLSYIYYRQASWQVQSPGKYPPAALSRGPRHEQRKMLIWRRYKSTLAPFHPIERKFITIAEFALRTSLSSSKRILVSIHSVKISICNARSFLAHVMSCKFQFPYKTFPGFGSCCIGVLLNSFG